MKIIKFSVMKMALYQFLIDKYENPVCHACDMQVGQIFIAKGWEKPEGMCDNAWASMSAYKLSLNFALGGNNI